MNKLLWYEVWTEEGISPPYVLLLLCWESATVFEIYDPVERRVAHQALTYDAARNWLLEDEYTQVHGRMQVE